MCFARLTRQLSGTQALRSRPITEQLFRIPCAWRASRQGANSRGYSPSSAPTSHDALVLRR